MGRKKLEEMLIEEETKKKAADNWWRGLSWKNRIEIHNELKEVY